MLRALRTRAVRVAACALVVAVAATGCFAGAPGGTAGDLYHLVNRDRGGGLAWDGRLAGLAQEWAAHVAAVGQPVHRPGGVQAILGLGFRGAAENVAVFHPQRGCNVSAAEIEALWWHSDPHRRNILGNYNAVGIGVACVNGRVGAVQDFGLR